MRAQANSRTTSLPRGVLAVGPTRGVAPAASDFVSSVPPLLDLAAGVDEVGRGPLAGPVYAAAVIFADRDGARMRDLPDGLRDSKKLSRKQREALEPQIIETAWAWSIAQATVGEIDRINILQASLLAMRRAVAALPVAPSLVLVDGNQKPRIKTPVVAVIGGDDLVPAIAAASILAKVARDRLMLRLDRRHPGYGFARHKGYATAAHRAALAELGATPAHRRSFAPVRAALQGTLTED